MPTLTLPGAEVLRLAGLDAHLLLRFEWYCLRICCFGAVLGMLILAPLYSSGKGGATGFYTLTLANIENAGGRLWLPVAFSYVFTAVALILLDREYTSFSLLRQDFLCYGEWLCETLAFKTCS